ncbi:MAG: TIGR04282 family arsenosugar biosynthesis glycosyltransferase [Verrucomicrobia bacterium]|nr:TIGR04282 family arsenosugar biosynthesis glycosyltransferase [Verrucomicrobiota bacterium]
MPRLLKVGVPDQVPPGFCALGIMTKAPVPGMVKTRLQPPLTAMEAAALNVCLLRDTASAISSAGAAAQGVAVFTPASSVSAYDGILPPDFYFIPQRGDAFGERLHNAVSDLLGAGFRACCLIDSDSPTVPASVFAAAVEKLGHDRIVIGPSHDGGYYLIGMQRLCPRLFREIDWSTPCVLEQTLERARESKLKVEMLPPFSDVDDAASLSRLCHELLEHGGSATAPATKELLEQLIASEGRERIWPE